MSTTKKIIAICGSTRESSTNLKFLNAIGELLNGVAEMEIYMDIASIPHFNPDLDTDNPPSSVTQFRNKLKGADGILICTPEYAMGVPGTLKNAIDWTVSSMEFSHKPVALITASSMGEKGHRSLLETLQVIESRMTPQTQLLISFAKTKINEQSVITDSETMKQVDNLLREFCGLL